jgi:hypothetical protein
MSRNSGIFENRKTDIFIGRLDCTIYFIYFIQEIQGKKTKDQIKEKGISNKEKEQNQIIYRM